MSTTAELFQMPHYALLKISGPDALKFLQGQCTCNFMELEAAHWLRGAHCNPKGRILFSFVASKLDDESIGLRVPADVAEDALADLKKYIVFSKATAQIESSIAIYGVIDNSIPLDNLQASTIIDHGAGLQEMWLTKTSHSGIELNPTQARQWDIRYMSLGFIDVDKRLRANFLPQDLNYDLSGAVNFKKGCYTGQEIVARMHYRGSAKKRLALGHIDKAITTDLTGHVIQAQDQTIGSVVEHQIGKNHSVISALIPCNLDDLPNEITIDKSHLHVRWKAFRYAINKE